MLLCSLVFCLNVACYDYTENINKCMAPTVMVIDIGSNASASGFIVRSEKLGQKYSSVLLTAYHAVDGKGPFIVRKFEYEDDGKIIDTHDYRMFLYEYDQSLDLAVGLFESDKISPTVTLGFDVKKPIGLKVHHVGFGLSDDARLDFGIITQPSTREPSLFAGAIRTNAYSISGDSGGPLFDEKNNVIGICQGIRTYKNQLLHHQSYFTDIQSIKKWSKSSDCNIDFLYNFEVKTPRLPSVKMGLQNYKYQIPEE